MKKIMPGLVVPQADHGTGVNLIFGNEGGRLPTLFRLVRTTSVSFHF